MNLQVGYGKRNITPDRPVPLAGYGNELKRFHTHVLDPVYAVCVAVSDGESTVLLFHLDLGGIPNDIARELKSSLGQAYGIPTENILLNCTHSHSAPALGISHESIEAYLPFFRNEVLAVAGDALADRCEAELFIGSGKLEGLNFVRRYLLSDGSYAGDNFGDFENHTIVGHETEADNTMQVVRFAREGKRDVVLVNWQAHPHITGGSRKTGLSSDLVGIMREAAEQKEEILVAFLQGCAGNINSHSRMLPKPEYTEVGHGLAEGLSRILHTAMRPVKAGKIRGVEILFEGPVNHATDALLPEAKRVAESFRAVGKRASKELVEESGFHSVYHALAVIRRSELPKTVSYPIGGVSFGDVCILWTPNELYDAVGLFVKSVSPFEMTFVLGYTNGRGGYMPTVKAFHHGGYGCDICTFPAGVTEKMASELLDLAVKLKK